jgi:hypothetical protein
MYKNILARNIVCFGLLGLALSMSVDWRLCTIERGKYLLGIFYNGYFQNTSDGMVYKDYLKVHKITHEFIQSHI